MITAPTAPSEFGTSVDDLAAAYSPQELQKRYKVTKELVYLLALQKLKSEMDAAQRSLAMSQQQQPGTIKDQMEGQVFQEKLRQVSGTIAQQEAQRRQRQQRMMASGGIVGYRTGTLVSAPEKPGFFSQFSLPDMDAVKRMQERREAEKQRLRDAGYEVPENITLEEIEEKLSQTAEDINEALADPVTKKRRAEAKARKQAELDAIRAQEPDLAGVAAVEAAMLAAEQPKQGKKDPTKLAEIKMRPATDFRGIAQDQALRVKDLSPALVDSLESQAAMTPEQMTQRRDAEAQRYLDKIGAKERTQGLQDLYDEQVAVLEAQADPDELRRRRQLAFFSNIGTGGIGSILRGGGRGLMKETDAQRKEARDAAQTKMTGYQSVHNFDISMIKDAEEKGLAILQLDRLDKRNAQTALSNISRQDLASINSYADRLRASEDSRIQEQFQKLELLQDNYENLRKDERLDYNAASALYAKIMEVEAAIQQVEVAKLPDDVRVLMLQAAEGATLSAKEQERVLKAQQVIDMAIKAALNKMGVLDTKEAIKDRVEAGFAGTRRSPVSPQQILGVGT